MTKISSLRKITFLFLTCILCMGYIMQYALAAQTEHVCHSSTIACGKNGIYFFATSHDTELGDLAWLICIKKGRESGAFFVPPHMTKLAYFKLQHDGTLDFESADLFGEKYVFHGTLDKLNLIGQMKLIYTKTGISKKLWRLDAVSLSNRASEHACIEGPTSNAQYSNMTYSDEGGDLTGVDIRLFCTNDGLKGLIVFYEGYWNEPTYTPLALLHITASKGVVSFDAKLPTGDAHYTLLLNPGGALFMRKSMPKVDPKEGISLKKVSNKENRCQGQLSGFGGQPSDAHR